MSRSCLFPVALLVIACCQDLQADDPKPGQQVPQVFKNANSEEKLEYLLYLPETYGTTASGAAASAGSKTGDNAKARFPLLLFLHGAGERGQNIALVKKHGPPKLIGQGQQMPFIVVSPQCAEKQRWEPSLLLALLDDLQSRYAVDTARIYVTGLSMGGAGTWSLVAAAPERFAAAIPICGRTDPQVADVAARLPVWIIVGDRDNAALVSNSLEMADLLRAKQADVKLTVMRGIGHDSWTQSYATPELYEWMLRHRREK